MTDLQAEALARATSGSSVANYAAIFQGFTAKGIPESQIIPRVNVLTFNAWKAKGRSVKKGEHGVKVFTFVECESTQRDPSDGSEKTATYRKPHTTTVFHISQTEETSAREARRQEGDHKSYRGWRNSSGRQVPDHHAEYIRDPGEDAADRWLETHR